MPPCVAAWSYAFGLQRRALPSAAAAQAAIAQGRLGEIYHARAVFTRAWGAPKGAGNWFRDPARAGGGALLDIGIHVLDLAWFLMGRPQPVAAFGVTHDRSPETSPLESAAFGLLRFAGGRSIQLEAAWILPEGDDRQYVHLHGTAAGALVERDRLTVIRVGEAGIEAFSTPDRAGGPGRHGRAVSRPRRAISPPRSAAQHPPLPRPRMASS